ncbi:MAG: putative MFS family arabinose efflux permease [Verrucomicrobiales bacterium]|jgi:predicted MFS family arabinose efflux permease
MTILSEPTQTDRSPEKTMWMVVAIAAISVMASTGASRSFGLFLPPVTESLGTGREVFSLAIGLQNLLFGLPLAAFVADRLGAKWVLSGCSALFGLGFFVTSVTASQAGLFAGLGGLAGFGMSGTGFVVVLGAVGRVVPAERRSAIFGLVTAVGSAGIFLMTALSQRLIDSVGWQTAMLWLSLIFAVVALTALFLPSAPTNEGDADDSEAFANVLLRARSNRSFRLLIAGFFVCGFHVAFIAAHLPAFLQDGGLDTWVSSTALGLIGLFNIAGSMVFGSLGDRIRKRTLLSILYSIRAGLMAVFLLVPLTTASALVFSAIMGFVWLATIPLTSGIVASLFGTRNLSSLYGLVFVGHQLGAFLGIWLGGRVFDATGSYSVVWLIAIVLGVMSAVIHLPIDEEPVRTNV